VLLAQSAALADSVAAQDQARAPVPEQGVVQGQAARGVLQPEAGVPVEVAVRPPIRIPVVPPRTRAVHLTQARPMRARQIRARPVAVPAPTRATPSPTNPEGSPSTQQPPRQRTHPIRSCLLRRRQIRSMATGRRSTGLHRLTQIQRRRTTSIPTGHPWGQVRRRLGLPEFLRIRELRCTQCRISQTGRERHLDGVRPGVCG
jgi:hypothetical protein